MNQPKIRIYTGKIQDWTSDVLSSVKAGNLLCGRRLFSLWTFGLGPEEIYFRYIHRADELYAYLEGMIEKGNHGKPYFRRKSGDSL